MSIRKSHRTSVVLLGFGLSAACSLTVPDEGELFDGGAGAAAKAGTSSQSGATNGGTGGGGTSSAGKNAGGDPGVGNEGGGAGDATNPVEMAGAGGEGGTPPVELPPAVLRLHYTFDDVSELLAEDVSGNLLDGTLAGLSLPIAGVGHIAGALQLNGAQKQYVQLPPDILDGMSAVSIASWIKLSQALAWDRLFDFNSGESNWFFFSPTGWNTDLGTFGTRCATRTPSALAPEIMLTETVSINTWHHITVVFAKPYLRYYLDGELKSEITNVSFGSDSLGKTNQNWIGRSVYAPDPYLSGLVDDFRIYEGALSAEEISELAAK